MALSKLASFSLSKSSVIQSGNVFSIASYRQRSSDQRDGRLRGFASLELVTKQEGPVKTDVKVKPTNCNSACEKPTAFENQVALITGGLSGIGFHTAREILHRGARAVVLVDNQDHKEAVACLQDEFCKDRIVVHKSDISRKKSLRLIFEDTHKRFCRIDILVNSAAILADQKWEQTICTNMYGVVLSTFMGIDFMGTHNSKGKGGTIINLSAIYGGFLPLYSSPVYAGSKHFVLGFTRALGNKIYGKTCVKIMALLPGITDTPLSDPKNVAALAGYKDFGDMGPVYSNAIKQLPKQKPALVACCIINMIEKGEHGDMYAVEDGKCTKVCIPDFRTIILPAASACPAPSKPKDTCQKKPCPPPLPTKKPPCPPPPCPKQDTKPPCPPKKPPCPPPPCPPKKPPCPPKKPPCPPKKPPCPPKEPEYDPPCCPPPPPPPPPPCPPKKPPCPPKKPPCPPKEPEYDPPCCPPPPPPPPPCPPKKPPCPPKKPPCPPKKPPCPPPKPKCPPPKPKCPPPPPPPPPCPPKKPPCPPKKPPCPPKKEEPKYDPPCCPPPPPPPCPPKKPPCPPKKPPCPPKKEEPKYDPPCCPDKEKKTMYLPCPKEKPPCPPAKPEEPKHDPPCCPKKKEDPCPKSDKDPKNKK